MLYTNNMMKKQIAIFDLDGTVINSAHRTPNKADGTLDLTRYFELRTRESIFKDTLLPLADRMKEMYDSGEWHIVICTAREMDQDDFDFLADNNLKFHECFDRNNVRKKYHWKLPDAQYKTKQLKKYKNTDYIFFDDAQPIIDAFGTYPNVTMIDATLENKRRAYA